MTSVFGGVLTCCCSTYVVDVLSANSRGNTLAVGGVLNAALVSKASLVVDQGPLSGIGIAVVKLAVLNSTELSSVQEAPSDKLADLKCNEVSDTANKPSNSKMEMVDACEHQSKLSELVEIPTWFWVGHAPSLTSST